MDDIKSLTLKELERILKEWGASAFHAKQIFSWIYKKGAADFEKMSNLPQQLRRRLGEKFYICGLQLAEHLVSGDGTEKFLFKLRNGNLVEAVVIPADKRITACISTQAGCRWACAFCASGLSGFKANLNTGEIIEQLLYLKGHFRQKRITHVVFMGTGEPLDNYDNLLKAARIINSPEALGIGARKITISTCGIIPGIRRLAGEGMQLELSVSLHAADERIRSGLMPVNKKYPLKDLIPVCKEYVKKTGRQITFEYILLKGLNSSLQNARELVILLKGMELAKVNLIPSNPVKELKVRPPQKKQIQAFKKYLLKHGVNVTIRRPRGEDIEAACGQLRHRYEKK
ncbi:MAG: 23S rRNA (adenine(2503)-C(2))-methyltransferase RlmN [Candidatus Omnitrophica bacterium]|nr:23S rRNA (adenine(2503)-C(2))-methyltransferase RlmN [Candidatus Omnitrophota bacterium]